MKISLSLAAYAALICLAAEPAHAVPYNIDSPVTTEPGRYTLDFAVTSTQTSKGESQTLPKPNVLYGVSNNVEIGVGTSLASARKTKADRANGLGDTNFTAKWRFHDETKNSPQLGINLGLRVPTASKAQGLGPGTYSSKFGLSAAKSFGRYTLQTCASYNLLSDAKGSNNWFYGADMMFQSSQRTKIGFQVYGSSPAAPKKRTDFGYGVGFQTVYAPDQSFSMLIGKSDRGYSDLTVYAGLRFIVGPHHHKKAKAK